MTRAEGTALNHAVEKLHEENVHVALAGCFLLEQFLKDSSPEHLEQLKDFVRSGIQDVEDHIRRYKARAGKRMSLISPRIGRNKVLGHQLAGHLEVIEQRTSLWRERGSVLRQIGDAVVWHMLQYDIRRIAPLYKPSTHQLPMGAGLAGVIQLQRNIHTSGEFLAMETDLTRCAGLGDLIVVRRNGRQLAPFSLEVKTREPAELKEGLQVDVLILTAGSGHPWDQDALQTLTGLLGKDLEGEMVVSERSERQAEEIASRTEIIADALTGGAGSLRAPDRNWAALNRVASRAGQTGSALDIAEAGVYYFGFAVRDRPSNESMLVSLRRDIRKFVSGELGYAVTAQLHEREDLSGLVPPIPLWRLPLAIRARVLAGKLVLGTFIQQDILAELLRNAGAVLIDDGDSWTIKHPDGHDITLGQLHTAAARLGMVVGALSPKSLADGIIEALHDSQPSHDE